MPLLPIAALVYALVWVWAAADGPNFVGCGYRRRGQRAADARRCIGRIDLFPMLLGFALLVMWKHIANIAATQGRDRAADRGKA